MLAPTVDALTAIQRPSESYIEYDFQRANLARSLAEKDENGQPRVKETPIGKEYIFPAGDNSFELALHDLREKFKDTIAEHETKMKRIAEFMEEEEDAEIHQVKLADFEAALDGQKCSLNGLFYMISEE